MTPATSPARQRPLLGRAWLLIVVCSAACGKAEGEPDEPTPGPPDNSSESSGGGGDRQGSGGTRPLPPEPSASGGNDASNADGGTSTGGMREPTQNDGGCPPLLPDAEDDCDSEERCLYGSSLEDCGEPLSVEASCQDGLWLVDRPVSCTPPDDCALPSGSYELHLAGAAGLGGNDAQGCLDVTGDVTRSFQLVQEPDSPVRVSGSWDVAVLDRCELTLTYFATYETDFEIEVDTETLIVRFSENGFLDARFVQEDSCGGHLEREMELSSLM